MIDELKKLGINLKHIDIGGGLGVCYKDETPPSVEEYANSMKPALEKLGLKVYMEPGRSISANAGVLLTKVDLLKPTTHRNFAIIDAAMNDLIRPALYEAWMDIQPVVPRTDTEEKYGTSLVRFVRQVTLLVKTAHLHYKKMTCWLYSVQGLMAL